LPLSMIVLLEFRTFRWCGISGFHFNH